jgi:site-specific DNA-methyltransferase (adenine-specific)
MIDLRLGDCLEVMKTIKDNSIDAIITDPPYGTTACKWDSVIDFELMWEQLNRIIKPNGAIVLFGSQPFTSALIMSNAKMFKYCWVWDKIDPSGHLNSKRMPLKQHEDICVFYKKQCTYNRQFTPKAKINQRPNRAKNAIKNNKKTDKKLYGGFNVKMSDEYDTTRTNPKSIITFSQTITKRKGVHPTQKCLEVMEYLIKTYTNENETVLDFTMGSGTTGVAANNLNRNFIGIEMDQGYFDIASERINKNPR